MYHCEKESFLEAPTKLETEVYAKRKKFKEIQGSYFLGCKRLGNVTPQRSERKTPLEGRAMFE